MTDERKPSKPYAATPIRVDRSGYSPVAYMPDGKVVVGEAAIAKLNIPEHEAERQAREDEERNRLEAEQQAREDAAARIPAVEERVRAADEAADAALAAFTAAVAADPVVSSYVELHRARVERSKARVGLSDLRRLAAGHQLGVGSGPGAGPEFPDALREAVDGLLRTPR